IGELFSQADRIKRVACRAEDRADLNGSLFEAPQRILAVIENDAAECVVNAVIQVVAEPPVANGLSDDLRDRGGGGRHQETPGLRKNIDRLRKEAVQLRVDGLCQTPEGGDRIIVVGGKTAADVEQLEIEAARSRLSEDARREL